MCAVPLLRRVCRESYSAPAELYEILKWRGMDLVTVTDHDSLDAAEELSRHPDFFPGEEITCRLPGGTRFHIGVYGLNERQHVELARRRDDLESLSAYLAGESLFATVNHIFSRLTGRREAADLEHLLARFEGLETFNGQMPARANRASAELAAQLG